jgi:hypothetical protein
LALCGQDVLDDLAERCGDFTRDDLILLPRVLLDNAGTRFLDDVTVEDFEARAPGRVIFARSADELIAAALSRWDAPIAEPAGV